jgi:hypothetical protein
MQSDGILATEFIYFIMISTKIIIITNINDDMRSSHIKFITNLLFGY